MNGKCSICTRDTPDIYMEQHHLIPKAKKGKQTISVCMDCGNQLHQLFSLNELRDTYNTVESLLSHEGLQKWVKWIRKKDFGICMKKKKRK